MDVTYYKHEKIKPITWKCCGNCWRYIADGCNNLSPYSKIKDGH